jgi:Na+/H+ antiporter NhaD/arsenite permease-like protein
MTSFITIVFVLTYIGMALGRLPGLRVDRTGIAMIAAVVLVAAGAVPGGEIATAIHFPTLLLMGGLMILSARVGAAGFYDAAAAWIARQAGRPLRLLALTIGIGGVLSALLINDIVVFAMTPLLCAGLLQESWTRVHSCSGSPPPATPAPSPRSSATRRIS